MAKRKRIAVPSGNVSGMMAMPPKMTQGMGSMGGPMMRPPVTRPPIPAAPIRRPPLMKAKGMPLAGFMPGPKKLKKVKKGQKRFAI